MCVQVTTASRCDIATSPTTRRRTPARSPSASTPRPTLPKSRSNTSVSTAIGGCAAAAPLWPCSRGFSARRRHVSTSNSTTVRSPTTPWISLASPEHCTSPRWLRSGCSGVHLTRTWPPTVAPSTSTRRPTFSFTTACLPPTRPSIFVSRAMLRAVAPCTLRTPNYRCDCVHSVTTDHPFSVSTVFYPDP